MIVRKAVKSDISRIIELLHQVDMVHHDLRPDLFKPYTTKYDEQELEALLNDESKPIFVCVDDGMVLGHAFCMTTEVRSDKLLVPWQARWKSIVRACARLCLVDRL